MVGVAHNSMNGVSSNWINSHSRVRILGNLGYFNVTRRFLVGLQPCSLVTENCSLCMLQSDDVQYSINPLRRRTIQRDEAETSRSKTDEDLLADLIAENRVLSERLKQAKTTISISEAAARYDVT